MLEATGNRAAVRPIQKFDGVHDRQAQLILQVGDAADVAGRDHIGTGGSNVADFPFTKLVRDLGLKDRIGAGRAAADMAFGNVGYGKAGVLQQRAWFVVNALPC